MRLPEAIGIGSRRCGSSWLHKALNAHASIGKPPNGLHYFSTEFSRGHNWYGEQLSPYAEREVLLEFSVSYLYPEYFEQVAKRIEATLENPKLFVCVRDPAARAFSDYLRSVRTGELDNDMSFDEAVRQYPELVNRGRYGQLLLPFYQRFGAEQIKVLFYQDLERDQFTYFRELTDFLGVDGPLDTSALRRSEPKGKALRSPLLGSLVRYTKHLADTVSGRLGVSDHWSNWKGKYMTTYQSILELNEVPRDISKKTESQLRFELHDDIVELEAMTGRDLKEWHDG